ncbi:MAG: hypothetical protein JWO00_513 [Candidatus Parcubacteria bacterium]|nr:hypothetical protein [Candidatus Parcubacteria bacterium]
MKPTSILILITKSNWGGAQRYVYDLATCLPKENFSVEVMAGGDGPLIERLRAAGIQAAGDLPIGRDVKLSEDLKAFFKLISILRSRKPDVLHVNSSKIGGLGALAGRMAGVKKIVFTAHGWAFNENRPLSQKVVLAFLYWITMILSHKTIIVSNGAKNQVHAFPFIRSKIIVIHNGTETETGYARKNARLELTRMNAELKKATDGVSESNLIWIGTIAELHPVKGYEYAIRAVHECIQELKRTNPTKRIAYTILGSGEERELLRDLVIELGLSEHVFFLGHVDGAAQFVKAFDIFLLASLSEGLGYVLIEAGAGSVPIVATAVGGIPEVVSDMESGILVQPRNSRELAHGLLFLVEHPEERRDYGAALKKKVAAEFSLVEMIKKTSEVYVSK